MKKLVLIFCLFFCGMVAVNATRSIDVKFSSCVDGDTAKFEYKKEVITARFLAVDTLETKHPKKGVEPFGKEASEYTCNRLKSAKNIKLEFDENSDEKDKYNRYLVWVFVDGKLLQRELISEGLASVAYLYGDYKYTDELESLEQVAEDKKIGIWSIDQNNDDTIINTNKDSDDFKEKKTNDEFSKWKSVIIIVGALIIIFTVGNTKSNKKIKNRAKKELNKNIKKLMK